MTVMVTVVLVAILILLTTAIHIRLLPLIFGVPTTYIKNAMHLLLSAYREGQGTLLGGDSPSLVRLV